MALINSLGKRLFKHGADNTAGARSKMSLRTKSALGAAGLDTVMNMANGDSFGTAAVKGAASGMLWTTAPGIMGAIMVGELAATGISAANQFSRSRKDWWNQQFRPNFGGSYVDSQRALTMRQAAVQAIQGSKMNARSALGGEARILSDAFYRGQ